MQREILSNQEEEIRKRDEKNSSIYGKKLEICSTKRKTIMFAPNLVKQRSYINNNHRKENVQNYKNYEQQRINYDR